MNSRRRFIQAAGAIAAFPLVSHARPGDEIIVYKGPQCGCCGQWEKHMRSAGFRLRSQLVDDIVGAKRRLGVPEDLWSCHTGVIEGYLIEGHVPASDVRRMLRERPKARGIAVPGMPIGSPGMEQGPAEPYETLAFDARRSWLFERH